MSSTEEIIRESLKGNNKCQKELYDKYASIMLNLCHRYSRNNTDAEDILQEGFIRVFRKLDSYQGKGSFEGWIRRIMINTAINYYRKGMMNATYSDYTEVENLENVSQGAVSNLKTEELLNIIQELPDDYRVIFNMFALEGYNHKEICNILNIKESTCRSKLFRARKMLIDKLKESELIIGKNGR